MATKKKAKLSVAHELHHLVGEVNGLRLDIQLVNGRLIQQELERQVKRGSIYDQPLPDFDLKTTMERDGGRCLYEEKTSAGEIISPARIVCIDRKSSMGYHLLALVNLKGHDHEKEIMCRRDGSNNSYSRLFTLPPPK